LILVFIGFNNWKNKVETSFKLKFFIFIWTFIFFFYIFYYLLIV
jgi:hypothetical protein